MLMQPFKYEPKVNTGHLRDKIEIHGKIEYENAAGETSTKHGLIKSIWARVIPQTGSLQKQQADTILTNVTHKIVVRYDAGKDIAHDMEIKFKKHLFKIKYILNPYFRNETLEIFVEEVIT